MFSGVPQSAVILEIIERSQQIPNLKAIRFIRDNGKRVRRTESGISEQKKTFTYFGQYNLLRWIP